jgi:hypothetical protein
MKRINRGALATRAFLAFFAVIVLALPHSAFAVIRIGQPNAVSLSQGLVGYWPFDGSTISWSTNRFNDISGQGNNATSTNMATSTALVIGKIGQALAFSNPSQQYLSAPNASVLNASGDFSWAFWVKTTLDASTVSWPGIVTKEDSGFTPRVGWESVLSSTAGSELNNVTWCHLPSLRALPAQRSSLVPL